METVEVILNLPESSIRKVRALAMLAGITVSDVEAQMAQMFDDMLSHNIHRELSRVDGMDPDDSPPKSYGASVVGVVTHDADKGEILAIRPVASSAETADDNGHSLSGDDDTGDTVSAEDAAAAPVAPTSAADDDYVPGITDKRFDISVPDVGENHDAYLDAAMRVQPAKAAPAPTRTRAARTAFDSRSPRVRILSTAEDEDAGAETLPLGFR